MAVGMADASAEGWLMGVDGGRNLIAITSSSDFTVEKNKQFFIKMIMFQVRSFTSGPISQLC